MNARVVGALLKKYEMCPECGNQYVGNGEGTLQIDDKEFVRTCKCGWQVKTDGSNESTTSSE